MLKATPTTAFKRDLKRYKHKNEVIKKLNVVLSVLVAGSSLPRNCFDHPLSNNWQGSRECHVCPDVLLIYRPDEKTGKLFLERFGSHAELF